MRMKTAKSKATPRPEGASNAFDRDTQYELRRKAILKEAGKAFEEHGAQGVSMTGLATRLSITTPALYYYFKSKQEMLYECYKISLDIGEQALETAYAEGGNAARILQNFIRHYMVVGLVEIRPTMALRDHISLTPDFHNQILAKRDALHNKLRNLVSRGLEDGSIAPCNPKLVVLTITGVVALVLRAYDPRGELSLEQITCQTVQLLTSGFIGDINGAGFTGGSAPR